MQWVVPQERMINLLQNNFTSIEFDKIFDKTASTNMTSENDEWFQDDQSLIDQETQAHRQHIGNWPKRHKKPNLQPNKKIRNCNFCKIEGHK